MDKQKYLQEYFNDLRKIMDFDNKKIQDLISVSEILLKTNNNGKKTLIFGNGGSAAIASHFSVDLTKIVFLEKDNLLPKKIYQRDISSKIC